MALLPKTMLHITRMHTKCSCDFDPEWIFFFQKMLANIIPLKRGFGPFWGGFSSQPFYITCCLLNITCNLFVNLFSIVFEVIGLTDLSLCSSVSEWTLPKMIHKECFFTLKLRCISSINQFNSSKVLQKTLKYFAMNV